MLRSLRTWHFQSLMLFCIGCIAFVWTGCSREAKRDRHLKKANRFYESKAFEKAEIEYRNALMFDRQNAFAWGRLGSIYFEQGKLVNSYQALSASLTVNPTNVPAQLMLLRICRDAHQVKRARGLSDTILKTEPGNDEALINLAETAVTDEEIADVKQRIANLRAKAGDRAVYHVVNGVLSERDKNWKLAEEEFKAALTIDPKCLFAHGAYGNLLWIRGDIPAATREFEEEIKLSPADRFAQLRLAEFKMVTGAQQEATKMTEAICKEAPDFLPARSFLAVLAFQDKRYDDCAALVSKILADQPQDYRALLLQARLSLTRKNVPEAIEHLKAMTEVYARLPAVHLELAKAYALTNDVRNALLSIDKALVINPNVPEALLMKGEINMRTGDYRSAVEAYARLTNASPRNIPARFRLAEAHRLNGSTDEALDIYRKLSAQFPTNAEPYFLSGLAYRQQKKYEMAEKAFAKAAELNTNDLHAAEQLIGLKIEKKDFLGARKLAESVCSKNPQNPAAWIFLAKANLADNQKTEAETALQKAVALDPNSTVAYQLLAELYVSSRRDSEALTKLNEALAKKPNNPIVLLQLATLQSQTTNYPGAAATYEKLLEIAPRSPVALNNLAALYNGRLGKPERAFELAAQARKVAPQVPEIADTFGWVLCRQGKHFESLSPLSEAAAKLPSDAEVQFHLGVAQYMLGNDQQAEKQLRMALQLRADFQGADEARRRLTFLAQPFSIMETNALAKCEAMLQKDPNDPVVLKRFGDVLAHTGNPEKARDVYERVLKINPNSVEIITKLATLYSEKLNDPARALELSKRATALAPENAEVTHAYGRALFAAGKHQESVVVLQDAAQKDKSNAELFYHLGRSLYSVGRISEAEQSMRTALALKPSSQTANRCNSYVGTMDQAGSMEAIGAILKDDPECLPARMKLGDLQAKEGKTKEARAAFEKILEKYPQFSPALRAIVLLPVEPENAGSMYDLALRARKAFPSDLAVAKALGRATYYRTDYPGAKRLLQEAIRAVPEDSEAYFYFGMTAYKLGETNNAVVNLRRAAELGLPDSLGKEATKILFENADFSNVSALQGGTLPGAGVLPGVTPK